MNYIQVMIQMPFEKPILFSNLHGRPGRSHTDSHP